MTSTPEPCPGFGSDASGPQTPPGAKGLLLHAMGDLQPPRELQTEDEMQWLEQQRTMFQLQAKQFVARVASHQE